MDDTEQQVIRDILFRQQMGIKKYGTTVSNNTLDLETWIKHAYEECLDMAIYLKRSQQEMQRKKDDMK